jgi:DNA mismatch endonuclease (patch repair protein)
MSCIFGGGVADIVSPAIRSRMMSGIRGKNTKPEIQLRKALHRAGMRYRLHAGELPGKPDLILPRYRAAIFVHGCFWHMHDCHLFKWPSTRKDFWQRKIAGNAARDLRNAAELKQQGWRVLNIWECALKGKTRPPFEEVVGDVLNWIGSDSTEMEIRGHE